jgi:hypothetical protein
MTTPPRIPLMSVDIAQLLDQLNALKLPAAPTDAQLQHHRAQVDRISVLIGGLRMLSQQLVSEKAQLDAQAQRLPHPGEVLCHLAARMPADFTTAQLVARYRTYAEAVEQVLPPETAEVPEAPEAPEAPAPALPPAAPAVPPAPPAPPAPPTPPAAPHAGPLLPDPLPPLEARAPSQLTYSLAWYLAQVTPEMQRHGWVDITPAGAQRHWQAHGQPQGRKWRPDAPAPFWGPKAEDAPPGAVLL